MIMNEVESGKLTALIARSADFYGPDTGGKSMLVETVVKNLLKGKKAQVFGNMDKIHSYTFTPDAGKATALLGNTPDAFNQVWHVPTTQEKLTTRQWIDLIAAEINVTPKIQKIPTWMLKLIGLFNPLIREFPEMLYKNELDYFFEVFRANEHLTTINPIFGELNYELNLQLLYKHAVHHLRQFGVAV